MGDATRRAPSTRSRACADGARHRRAGRRHRPPTTRSRRFSATLNGVQPQGNRAAAWCRDTQQGRSFYTELGSSSAERRRAEHPQAPGRRDPVGRRARPRQLQGHDQLQLHVDADHAAEPEHDSNQYTGEMTKSALADDGRLFYGGRAICFRPTRRSPTGTRRTRAWAAAPSTSGTRACRARTRRTRPRSAWSPNLSVFGAKGSTPEYGQNATSEAGLVAHDARPQVHQGPPVHVHPVLPLLGRRAGQGHRAQARPGLRLGRALQGREAPVALHLRRRHEDVRARLGEGHLLLHLAGLQLLPQRRRHGLGLQGQPVRHQRRQRPERHAKAPTTVQPNGGYTNPHPQFTIPCPAPCLHDTHCGQIAEADRPAGTGDADQLRRRARDVRQHQRLRGQDHPHQAARRSGRHAGRRHDVHDSGSRRPNGANLFAPGSAARPGRQGQARDLRDGRAQHVHDPHRSEDRRDHHRVDRPRPDQPGHHLGPGQDRERDDDELGRQLGLAVLPGR